MMSSKGIKASRRILDDNMLVNLFVFIANQATKSLAEWLLIAQPSRD